MKHTGKRLFSILLTLALVIGLMPSMTLTAAAAGESTVTVSTLAQLQTALDNPDVSEVIVSKTISLSEGTNLDGKGKTIRVETPYIGSDGLVLDSGECSNYGVFSTYGTVTIKNMTIMGGKGSYSGTSGAIQINSGTATLENVTATRSNRGVYIGSSRAILKNCNVVRNAADYGGGILNSGGTLIMDGCSLSECRSLSASGGGGAMEIKNNGKLYANNTVIANNSSTEIGGAINCYDAYIYLMNCTVTGNITTAGASNGKNGGGMGINSDKGFYAVNCVLIDNFYYNKYSRKFTKSDIGFYNSSTSQKAYLYNCLYTAAANADSGYPNNEACKTGTEYSADAAAAYRQDGVLLGERDISTGFKHPGLIATKTGGLYVPIKAAKGAATGGAKTYFEYTADAATVKMGYDKESSIVGLGTLEAPAPNKQVVKYYEGTDRVEGVIGASGYSEDDYYTVRLDSGFTGGTVEGATIYGDTYVSGKSITVQATANSGMRLLRWEVSDLNDPSAPKQSVSDNPYTFTLTQDTLLKPVFVDANKKYVIYDPNGGTGSMDFTEVTDSTVTLSANTFTKDNSTFLGWDTNPSGTTAVYDDNEQINAPTEDLTLYAVWLTQEPVIFYSDMAGQNPIGDAQICNVGASLNTVKPPSNPPKSGFYFAGWSTKKAANTEIGYNYKQALKGDDVERAEDGSEDYILSDFSAETTDTVTGPMSFYPVFVKDRLEIHLDLGAYDEVAAGKEYPWYISRGYESGATNAVMDPRQNRQFTVNIDEKIRMLYVDDEGNIDSDAGMIRATRPGYDLAGWYTGNGVLWNGENWQNATTPESWVAMTPEYTDNSTPVKHPERPYNYHTVTLTAKWTPKTVIVEYDLAGGTQSATTGDRETALGSTLTLDGAPTKGQYKFVGWKIGTSDTLHSAGETFTFNDWSLVTDGVINVTAQYAYDPTLHIEFNTNGGTAIEPISGTAGSDITILDKVKNGSAVTKEGYTFSGWFSDEALTTPVTVWPTTMPAGNTTYYANWTVNPYTITFNMNGATSDQIDSITQDYDTPVTTEYNKDQTKAPTRTHYTFSGWNPAVPAKMPAHDLTVEAIWEPIKYKVTFQTDADDTGRTFEDNYGALITPPDVADKDNLIFVEWSVPNPIYMPESDLESEKGTIITAKWKPNPTPVKETVWGKEDGKLTGVTGEMQYRPAGTKEWIDITGSTVENLAPGNYEIRYKETDDFKSDAITTVTIEDGTPITVTFDCQDESDAMTQDVRYGSNLADSPTPTRSGYSFAGWYKDKDCKEKWDVETDKVTKAITLYAKWTPAPAGTSYPVNVAKSENGTVKADKDSAAKGSKVTLTVTPDEGYEADKVTVTDQDGKEIPVTRNDDGTYSFQMPEGPVNVTATFSKAKKPIASPEESGVADWLVTDDHIIYISGYADGSVKPEGNITRAEVAMIFYRLLKNQDVEITASFSDVKDDAWYAEAVTTLASIKIITGYEDGTFAPNKQISRAEFTAIATRFAIATGGNADFSDVPTGHWAKDNIATASDYGWINGYEDGTFAPGNPIRRAEVATIVNHMLARAADEAYVSSNSDKLIQFSDLKDPESWYYLDMVEATNEHDFDMNDGKETWK